MKHNPFSFSAWCGAATLLVLSLLLSAGALHHPAHPPVSSDLIPSPAARLNGQQALGRLPLAFEANRGQSDKQVRFLSRGPGYSLFLTAGEAVLSLRRSHDGATAQNSATLRLKLLGANPSPRVGGERRLAGVSHYFLGDDPALWRTSVPRYGGVRYEGVYPGVDLVFHGNRDVGDEQSGAEQSGAGQSGAEQSGQQLEYDFVVAPGVDPSKVRLGVQGADKAELNARGDLVLHTPAGSVVQHAPVVYQTVAGQRHLVAARYILPKQDAAGAVQPGAVQPVAFRLAAYDKRQPLIIDPVLAYSTFLGGSGNEVGWDIAVDASGNAYVVGSTPSANFPRQNAAQAAPGGNVDAFVARINAAGTALDFSTYLGGSAADHGRGIALDGAGRVYVTGYTASSNFPRLNGLQSFAGKNDAFVTRLTPTGTLDYSTFLGGSEDDFAYGIAADAAGRAYVTGSTKSTNFSSPTPTALGGKMDAFVARLNATGTGLEYSSLLGGTEDDIAYGIAVDGSGNAVVAGSTLSPNFPRLNAFQTTSGGKHDAFVARFNASGTRTFSSLLGGTDEDFAYAVALDGSGNAVVVGSTRSPNFPTLNPFQGYGTKSDGFITRVSPTGALIASSYLGGKDDDFSYGVAVDGSGNAYVTGSTKSDDFPIVNPVTTAAADNKGIFATEVNAAGTGLVFSTVLGGTDKSEGNAIAVDGAGDVFLTGTTQGDNFPVSNALQPSGGGGDDAFVMRLNAASAAAALSLQLSASALSENGGTVTATVSRNTSTAAALTVNLATSNAAQVTVPASIVIPAGATSATFLVAGVNNALVDGTRSVAIAAAAAGFTGASATVGVTDDDVPTLTLSLNLASAVEGASVVATVGRNTPTTDALAVDLSASDATAVTLPAQVTIPAGRASASFAVNIADDAVVNGTRTVTLSANATGYVAGTASLQIVDNDVPTLSLDIMPRVWSERGGAHAATGTVSRNTAVTSPLTVSLASSDLTEARVLATVTIPAGATSASFDVAAVNDNILDGSQTVNISATASGFAGATVQCTVLDDDGPALTLSITPRSFRETAGASAATGTVTRNTPTTSALPVRLSSSDTTEARVPNTVAIPAGRTSVSFPITAVDDNLADGPQLVTIGARAGSLNPATQLIRVTDNETPLLRVTLSAPSVREGAAPGGVTGTVTRNTPPDADLTVNLAVSNANAARVPATVVIPAGQSAATFSIAPVNDDVATGPRTTLIAPSAVGFGSIPAQLTVLDEEVPTFTLSVDPASLAEGGGATATLTRNTQDLHAITVAILNSDRGALLTPSFVTLPLGQATVTFPVTAVENAAATASRTVTLEARRTGFVPGAASVTITDNDVPSLSLLIRPTKVSERAGAKAAFGFITRNTPANAPLTVTLASGDPSLTVPARVVIPAGAIGARFIIGAVDDAIVTGNRVVSITASATGLADATAAVSVLEDDVPALRLSVTPTLITEGGTGLSGATGIVTRNTPTGAPLTVALRSIAPAVAEVPPSVTIPAGAASASFPISAPENNVATGPRLVSIRAEATGFLPAVATLAVRDNDKPALALRLTPASVTEGGTATATLERNTPTDAALTVALASSNPAQAGVPASVVIPIGTATVTFPVQTIDNTIADGPRTVTISAAAPGLAPAKVSLQILDNELPSLHLSISPAVISENGGTATATLTRDGTTTVALTVTLVSSLPGKATVPTSVTIPAGSASVTFPVTAVNNAVHDDDQVVTITASASSFNTGTASLTVADDDRIRISISPTTANLTPGQSLQFTATVTSAVDSNATFSVREGTSGGTISASGLYTAPATPGTYHVVAVSRADTSQSATAVVTVAAPPIAISISPTTANLTPGQSVQFTATVSGAVDSGVTFSVREGAAGGTISSSGLYTAPAAPGTYHVVAVSRADASQSATAVVTVTAQPSAVILSFGLNDFGEIGDGSRTDRDRAVTVSRLQGARALAADGSHSLAIGADGTVYAWGFNRYGQLGDGTTVDRNVPTPVAGLSASSGVLDVAAGWYHSLALRSDGTVLAWGLNDAGQLGDGTNTNRAAPTAVSGLTGVQAIAAGLAHSLALRSDGTVVAWGDNRHGQLGDGTNANRNVPVVVRGLGDVVAVAANGYHSLALRRDGTVVAWGWNFYGQLGDGTVVERTTPVVVRGLAGIKSIAAGYGHSLAADGAGRAYAWGDNQFGQLGDGTTTGRNAPVVVSGLTDVRLVRAGVGHSIALRSDGTLAAWGWNLYGTLGDGTRQNRSTPVAVPSVTNVSLLATGYAHNLVLGQLELPASSARAAAPSLSTMDASASQSQVHLSFVKPLGSSAADASHYAVGINGAEVAVMGARADGENVTLQLPPGTLRVGDRVTASWHGLGDADGRAVADGVEQAKVG